MRATILICLLVTTAALPIWALGATPSAVFALCGLMLILSGWYVWREARLFRGLTFTSMFVASTCFVFVTRAAFIAWNNDFSLVETFGLRDSYRQIVNAMGYVVFTTAAFIAGGATMERRIRGAVERRFIRGFPRRIRMNMSQLFIYAQIALSIPLIPLAFAADRNAIFDMSSSAYVYMLPTLIHGFDLYWFVHAFGQWWRTRDPVRLVLLIITIALIIGHAFLLSNLTFFRAYYLIGIFCCAVAALNIVFRRIPVVIFVSLILIYPMFKFIGVDRTLNSRELIELVARNPAGGYSSEGLLSAFGSGTDLNMIDTFAASLAWPHSYRPYLLTFPYILVHWIPRSWWPTKPQDGVLGDMGYLYLVRLGVRAPFSPGLIGILNDDGGQAYMIAVMFAIGWFMRRWQWWTLRVESHDLYISICAALMLTSLVLVRYIPYQAFYLFATFFLPCWLCDRLAGRLSPASADPRILGKLDPRGERRRSGYINGLGR